MTELLRHYLLYSFHSLTKYDYMAIGWIIFLALLFLVLSAFVRKNNLSYFLLFLGMVLLFFGPPAIKITLDRFLRDTAVTLTVLKPLKYSRSLLLEGNLTNTGKIDFSSCDLLVSIFPPKTPLKGWAAYLRPRRVEIFHLNTPLPKEETKPFRLLVDDFKSDRDFNATVLARCYP